MRIELQMLAWGAVLGLVQLFLVVVGGMRQRSVTWRVGARDDTPPPLTGVPARLERAQRNFMETFPLFAAAVLVLAASGRADANSALGAQLWLGARVAYVPLYAAGVAWVRSLAWAAALVGLAMVLLPLLHG